MGPHAQLPAPWDIWPAILVLLHVFRLYNLQTVTRDEFITASKRGPHSIWKTQPEAIPCKFWLHSAHVAQHPQVILGRALGHQCRHPPRLNHEQLLSKLKLVIPRWWGGLILVVSPVRCPAQSSTILSQEPTPFLVGGHGHPSCPCIVGCFVQCRPTLSVATTIGYGGSRMSASLT